MSEYPEKRVSWPRCVQTAHCVKKGTSRDQLLHWKYKICDCMMCARSSHIEACGCRTSSHWYHRFGVVRYSLSVTATIKWYSKRDWSDNYLAWRSSTQLHRTLVHSWSIKVLVGNLLVMNVYTKPQYAWTDVTHISSTTNADLHAIHALLPSPDHEPAVTPHWKWLRCVQMCSLIGCDHIYCISTIQWMVSLASLTSDDGMMNRGGQCNSF